MPNSLPQRMTLPNGLRLVVQQVSGLSAVGVAVHYGVGFRSETPGKSGFAHLFEHMMFQGSRNVGRGEHFALVQGSGGSANGATFPDYTDYHQVIPSAALERVLFLEADRMASLDVTGENLRTQRDVVKEEIRLNVLNKPYGGFPWTVLPGVLYDHYPNAHNGYGEFGDLDRATVEDCAEFYAAHYAPGNAVVTVCGDIEAERAAELAAAHFGPIQARPVAPAQDLAEPHRGRAHGAHTDRHAPYPATALGFRMPDPTAELDSYVAHMVLSALLTSGEGARLKSALAPAPVDVSSGCGLFGPLQARDPDTFVVVATHPRQMTGDQLLETVHTTLDKIASGDLAPHEVERAVAITVSGLHQRLDSLMARARSLGTHELLFGRPGLAQELPGLVGRVTAARVAEAAADLARAGHAVLSLTQNGRPE